MSSWVLIPQSLGHRFDKRLRNQRPTLVVPPDVSTSVKEIWIGNVLLLETFLLKFLPAPRTLTAQRCFRVDLGIFIYLSVESFNNPEQGGGAFRFEILMQLRAGMLL